MGVAEDAVLLLDILRDRIESLDARLQPGLTAEEIRGALVTTIPSLRGEPIPTDFLAWFMTQNGLRSTPDDPFSVYLAPAVPLKPLEFTLTALKDWYETRDPDLFNPQDHPGFPIFADHASQIIGLVPQDDGTFALRRCSAESYKWEQIVNTELGEDHPPATQLDHWLASRIDGLQQGRLHIQATTDTEFHITETTPNQS